MKFDDYTEQCLTTWNTQKPQLANAALGLLGEYAEYEQYHLTNKSGHIDELGDFMYYYAITLHLLDKERPNLPAGARHNAPVRAYEALCNIAEGCKKVVYHDKRIKDIGFGVHFDEVERWLRAECYALNLNLPKLLDRNIEKLRKRHGDQFTTDY